MAGRAPAAAVPPPAPYASPRAAFRGGVRDALGAPVLVMTASYLGFGSLIRASELSVAAGVFSSLSAWALPGQVASVELYAGGASIAAIVIAVLLINFRLMPMVVSLLPLMERRSLTAARALFAAHIIAVTTWAMTVARATHIPPEQRLPYLYGCGLTLYLGATLATVGGYVLAGLVPAPVTLGLVFVNPFFILVLLVADLRERARWMAILAGALLSVPAHLATPTWGLLIAGVAGGSLAYGLDRRLAARARRA